MDSCKDSDDDSFMGSAAARLEALQMLPKVMHLQVLLFHIVGLVMLRCRLLLVDLKEQMKCLAC
eukprot:5831055-Karenia_brevis.AAC.1